MNRQILQSLASDWTRKAKNDIRTKVKEFMAEVETTPRELAYALAISEGELEQILSGNGEITLSTFAKLLIATGNALEIKPIGATPIGDFSNLHRGGLPPHFGAPSMGGMQPPYGVRRGANMFDRAKAQQHMHGNANLHRHMPPMFDDIEDDWDDEFANDADVEPTPRVQPRDSRGRFQSFDMGEHAEEPQSKFSSMTRDKLKEIIKNNLWDSEIDIFGATKDDLVKFLDEKDKKITAMRRRREVEADPSLVEFKNRIKNSLKTNPHLREYLKDIIED